MSDSSESAWVLAEAAARARKASPLERDVTALFDQFRSPLLRYLMGLGLAVQDAEEIVQEVFLALFQHLQRGKSRENLRGWVFRVAHNLGLKRVLKQGYARGFSEPDALDTLTDPGPDPEAQSAANQQKKHLEAALHALPEQDQRCLSLRAEGLRYREIAAVLNMSLGAVSLSLSRSLARLARVAGR